MLESVVGGACDKLDSLGHALVTWVVRLNVGTALLLAGAMILDRALSRRTRASLRIALYVPIAARVAIPPEWGLRLPRAERLETVFAPLLRVDLNPALPNAAQDAPSWYALAAFGYLLVAALLAVRVISASVRLQRALGGSREVAGMALRCPVVEHAELGPMVVGLFTPRLVLPSRLLRAGNEHALSCVVRHETAHLERGDAWLSAALRLLVVAAWPVAPVWVAAVRVRQLIELACDERALAGADPTERRRYGHALLDIAEWRSFGTGPMGAGELYFGSTLRARVEALAEQRLWPIALQRLVLPLAVVALFAACAAAAPATAHSTDATSREPDPTGYGYEFAPDTVEKVTAAPAHPLDPPLGPGGRLVPEAIEDVVRNHFGATLSCYERGRSKNPKLAGRVTVKFVIGEDGNTKEVADEGSTLLDREVVQCIVEDFRKRHFPTSRRGNVTVIYPIQLGS